MVLSNIFFGLPPHQTFEGYGKLQVSFFSQDKFYILKSENYLWKIKLLSPQKTTSVVVLESKETIHLSLYSLDELMSSNFTTLNKFMHMDAREFRKTSIKEYTCSQKLLQ